MNFLQKAQSEEGRWKISYRYRADGYVVFDKGRNAAEWLSYTINKALEKLA